MCLMDISARPISCIKDKEQKIHNDDICYGKKEKNLFNNIGNLLLKIKHNVLVYLFVELGHVR